MRQLKIYSMALTATRTVREGERTVTEAIVSPEMIGHFEDEVEKRALEKARERFPLSEGWTSHKAIIEDVGEEFIRLVMEQHAQGHVAADEFPDTISEPLIIRP